MSFDTSFRISASSLTAQRLRLDVISGNIANASTTRTPEGGPYRRREVVLNEAPPFRAGPVGFRLEEVSPGGVRVARIAETESVRLVSDPKHPDADADGFVAFPDVDLVQEMTDMMSAVRAYEASAAAINAAKNMALKALEIGRG